MNPATRDALSIPVLLDAIEEELRASMQLLQAAPYQGLREMIAYHFGWEPDGGSTNRGKRVRPLLTLLSCAAAGGDWRAALPAAASVELIHNFSLVHDDIEDASETRRGRQTLWKRWSLAQGINTGDALFVMAQLAASHLHEAGVPAEIVLAVKRTLDEACLRLTMGQYLDLSFESRPSIAQDEYIEMISGKTSALLAASAAVGAMIAGASASRAEAYQRFGLNLGLAFQMLDDVLGIWGSADVTGKPTGDDLRARKKSLPVILGLKCSPAFAKRWASADVDEGSLLEMRHLLEEAGVLQVVEEHASEHTRRALEALAGAAPLEPAGTVLRNLALKLLKRTH